MSVAFKVISGDRSLQLLPGTRIKMLFKSAFFMNAGDAPTRTFTFNVPAESNQEFFKYANLLDVIDSTYFYQGRVELGGKVLGDALILVEEFSQDLYKARVTVGRGNFVLNLDRSLRSFNYKNHTPFRYNVSGGDPTLPYREYTFSSNTPPPGTDPVLVHTIVSFWSTALQQQFDLRISFNPFTDTFIDHLDAIVSAINALSPDHCIWAKRVSGTEIRVWDLAANDVYPEITFEPEELDWYLYFNDVVLSTASHPDPIGAEYAHAQNVIDNTDDFDYCYFPVYAPLLSFGITGFDYKNVINHYFPASNSPGPAINGLDGANPTNWIKDNVLMPYPNMYKTLRMIFEELKITVQDDFFDAELKTLTFFSPMFMELFHNYISGGLVTRSFRFNQILPDIKLGELLDNLKILFGMISDFDSRDQKVFFTSRKAVINSPEYDDWTDKVAFGYNCKRQTSNLYITIQWPDNEPLVDERILKTERFKYKGNVDVVGSLGNGLNNDYKLVYKENNLYRKSSDFTFASWFYYCEGLDNYTYPTADENQDLQISTLFSFRGETVYTKNGLTVKWLLPQTNQPIYRFDDQTEIIKPQLVFYRGKQTVRVQEAIGDIVGEVDGEAPLGTYHNYDILGNKIGNYNLALNHPDGPVAKWLSEYIELRRNSSPVTFTAPLNDNDLHNLELLRKKKIDNQRYLIDEVEVEFEEEEIVGSAKITAWPVKFTYGENA